MQPTEQTHHFVSLNPRRSLHEYRSTEGWTGLLQSESPFDSPAPLRLAGRWGVRKRLPVGR